MMKMIRYNDTYHVLYFDKVLACQFSLFRKNAVFRIFILPINTEQLCTKVYSIEIHIVIHDLTNHIVHNKYDCMSKLILSRVRFLCADNVQYGVLSRLDMPFWGRALWS